MHRFLTFFIVLVAANIAVAQSSSVKFVGKASHETIGKDERFTITYTINSRGQSFRPPENMDEHFMVLVGPNQSLQSTMTNQGFQATMTVSYTLRPKTTGTFTMTPARVMVGGTPHQSNAISIEVVEGKTQAEDPNDPEVLVKKLSWMKALLSRTEVFVGEPISVNYKLYSKTGVSAPRYELEPNFKGFIAENIDIERVEQKREFIDNEQVLTAVVRSFLLFPQQPGNYDAQTIPVTIPTNVQVQRRDSWFGSVTQRVDNNTHIYFPSIKVKPLPVADRPDDFSGGVGRFTLSIEANRTSLDADQSLTVTITLKGEGNMRLIDIPKLDLPSVFEAYDPRINTRLRVSDGTLKGTKVAECLLIPRYSGTFEIPALRFSYFDPKSKRYKEETTEPITIEVTGDKRKADAVLNDGAAGGSERADLLSKDIMFIKTAPAKLKRDTQPIIQKTWYWMLWILSLLMIPAIWMVRNLLFKQRNARNTRMRKAERQVTQLIKQAIQASSDAQRGKLLHKAMETYFSARLNINTSDLSKDRLREASMQAFGGDFTEEWMAIYESLESLQYSGTGASTSIEHVENTIKQAREWA